jgi:MFS family permease
VNNLHDGVVWGAIPVLLASSTADVGLIGLIVGVYPITWGIAQLATGPASDRLGRKGLIVGGMLLQGASIAAAALWSGVLVWTVAMVGLGIGTAAVYPTLLGAVSDVAHPAERAGVIGVYRFWRDLGYPVGAVAGGLLADAAGLVPSLMAVAVVTGASGLLFAVVARETAPGRGHSQISIGPPAP